MKIYVATCSWENRERCEKDHFSRAFKFLSEAKAWLKSEYESAKQELDDGAFSDDYDNDVSIDDDGMSYSQEGQIDSKTSICELEIIGESKSPKRAAKKTIKKKKKR